MIYLVYQQQALIAETDSLDYIKKVVKTHSGCSVQELGSRKVFKPRLVRKSA